jgi:uncharacterized coiled-coil protein SlyX
LECDLEVKREEAETLRADKARLQDKLNDSILQVSNQERNLKMSAQTNDFFEQEKNREVGRVQKLFDQYKHRVLVEQMVAEDGASHLLRAQTNLANAKIKIAELTAGAAARAAEVAELKDQLAKLTSELTDTQKNLSESQREVKELNGAAE